MHVDSADRDVRRLIWEIATTVESNGGRIHPELVVHHDGPHLWLSLPRSANPFAERPLERPAGDAAPMLQIPDQLHIPVVFSDWEDDSRSLRFLGDDSALSKAQSSILHAMVDLFNACDKVSRVGQSYPAAALQSDPELLTLIREARPGWGEGESPVPSRLFLNSRLRGENGDGEEGPVGYLMPMIDMLNHHPYGSRYEKEGDQWLIRVHHPEKSDQVFVRYNKADALGVALGLGYFEPATRFVSSVACEVVVPDLGTVTVAGVGVNHQPMPAPRVTPTPVGLTLEGVQLAPDSVLRLHRLLSLPVRVRMGNLSERAAERLATTLIGAVCDANRAYFTKLAAVADREGDLHGLRHLMREVARHQLSLLDAVEQGVLHSAARVVGCQSCE